MIKKSFYMLLAGILLSGCSPFKSTQPPAVIYGLHADSACAKARSGPLLSVPLPQVPAGLETEKIALHLMGGRRLDYYSGAQWPEPLDALLQDFIIQSSRHTCHGMLAAAPGYGVPADYNLVVKVNDFQPIYAAAADATPHLRVSATFTLTYQPERKVLTDFTLSEEADARANTLTAVTAGMESLLRAVVARAFQKISNHAKAE